MEIINEQAYAHPFEYTMRDVFHCEIGGADGMADANYIQKNPFTAVEATCKHIYAYANFDKNKKIDEFLDEASIIFKFDFNTLLAIDSNDKRIPGYNNGKEAIEALEEKFMDIFKK